MNNLTITADLPNTCPSCGAELVWKGVDLVCPNDECSAKVYNKLYRFISVVGCNGVKNVGPAMIDDMINIVTKEYENDTVDINDYMLSAIAKMNDILKTTFIEDNYGKATAQKYRSVFENICTNSVDKDIFLYSMNISGLGWKTCQMIVSEGVLDMMLTDEIGWAEKLVNIKGIGSSVASKVIDNLDYIKIMASQVLFTEVDESEESVAIPTKFVTVTGSLSVSRSTFDRLIQGYGWAVDSNIKNSEYLVTNNPDPTSSKGKKAKELGKTIVTEHEFYRIIGMTPAPSVIEVGDVI